MTKTRPNSRRRQCADGLTPDDAWVIDNFLKLSASGRALLLCWIRLTSEVKRIANEVKCFNNAPEFVGRWRRQDFDGLAGMVTPKQNGRMGRRSILELHNRVFS